MIPEHLMHYADPNDYNHIFYHQRNDGMEAIIQALLADSDCPLGLCRTDFEEATEYQLFTRCLSNQTVVENEKRRLRIKEDGTMNSSALQNPSDPNALADFEFNEDGMRLLKCAAGHEPISQSYTKTTRQCRVSFDRNHCAGCTYQNQCHPKIYKKVATFITSKMPPTEQKARDICKVRSSAIWQG
ncbi:MAG: hypothetical protein HDQ97_17305 [Lachnospiraceae bacterium]|nr:hypothetical protein [Lachnospiraceae bacterium]